MSSSSSSRASEDLPPSSKGKTKKKGKKKQPIMTSFEDEEYHVIPLKAVTVRNPAIKLNSIIREKESKTLDFKMFSCSELIPEAQRTLISDPKTQLMIGTKCRNYFVAFSNTVGGTLLFGVEDKSRKLAPTRINDIDEEAIIKKVDGLVANSVYPQVEALDYTLSFPHIENDPFLKLVRFDVKPSKKFYVYKPKRDKGFVSYQRLTESNLMLDWETIQNKIMSHLDTNNDVSSPIDSVTPTISRLFNDPFEKAVPVNKLEYANYSNVPHLPYTHVQRFALTKEIIPTYLINDKKRVTCIYGMGGIGKTVLSIELAKDSVVQKYFRDGIFWLRLGQTEKSPENYQHQFLSLLLNINLQVPPDYQRGISQLAQIIGNRKLLLVLDDAWYVDQLRGFNLMNFCPNFHILVNSRNQSLMSVFGPHVSYMSKLPPLTLHETKQIIAKWMDMDINELPPFIIHYFKENNLNNPLVLNLLCSILSSELDAASHNIKEREWRMVLKDFGCTYITSEIALHDYEKSGVLATVLINSIQALDKINPKLVHLYKQLVVFEGYKEFNLNLLNMLWDCNTNSARMNIRQLSKHSLLEWHDDGDTASLHNIQTECLQYMLDSNFIAKQHEKFITSIEHQQHHDEYTKAYYYEQCCYHYLFSGRKQPIEHQLTSIEFILNHYTYVKDSLKLLLEDYNAYFSKFCRIKHACLTVPLELPSKPPKNVYTYFQILQLASRFVTSKITLQQQFLARFLSYLKEHDSAPTKMSEKELLPSIPKGYDDPHLEFILTSARQCLEKSNGHIAVPTYAKFSTKMADNLIYVDSMINDIYVSTLYKKLFVAQNTGDIQVYNVEGKEFIKTLQSHSDEVRQFQAINESLLASCSIDGSIKIWDMEHDKLFQSMDAPTQLFCLAIYHHDHLSEYLLFAGSTKGKTYIFNAAGKLINSVTTGCNYISALCVHEEAKKLYIGSFDCSLRCVDLTPNDQQFSIENEQLIKLKYKIKSIRQVTLYKRDYLLVGCYQNIYLVDIDQFKVVHTYTNKKILEVKSMVVVSNGFYASSYGCVHQWSFPSSHELAMVNKRTLEPQHIFEYSHSRLITSIALYNKFIISGSFEESVQYLPIKKNNSESMVPLNTDKQWWHRKNFMVESTNPNINVVYKMYISNIFVSQDHAKDLFKPLGGHKKPLVGLKCFVKQPNRYVNYILNYNSKKEEHFTLWSCFGTKKVKCFGLSCSVMNHHEGKPQHILAMVSPENVDELIIILFKVKSLNRVVVNMVTKEVVSMDEGIALCKNKSISSYQPPLWVSDNHFALLRSKRLIEVYHHHQENWKVPTFAFSLNISADINCMDAMPNAYFCFGGDDRQLHIYAVNNGTDFDHITTIHLPHLILECQLQKNGKPLVATSTLDRVIRCFQYSSKGSQLTHEISSEHIYNSICWTSRAFTKEPITALGVPVKRVYPPLYALNGSKNHIKVELLSHS